MIFKAYDFKDIKKASTHPLVLTQIFSPTQDNFLLSASFYFSFSFIFHYFSNCTIVFLRT